MNVVAKLLCECRYSWQQKIVVLCILGPDWKWGNQDGGTGNIGRVYGVSKGLVEVIKDFYI